MENVGMDEIRAVSDAPRKRFLVDELVEVRQLGKGLRGSWHPAKVVEVLSGKRMVEYEELIEKETSSTKLRELVPVGRASDGTLPPKSTPKKSKRVLRLRPRPPVHPHSQPISWKKGNCIEYKFNDAWWVGVLQKNITRANVDDVSLVHVHFPDEKDSSKVKLSDLRIGQEWEEETGIWSLKRNAPVPVPRSKEKKTRGGLRKRPSSELASNRPQKKRGGLGKVSSPENERRVTRSLSLLKGVEKSADGSGPSCIRSENMVPGLSLEDSSDVDGDEKREIDTAIPSGRKGTRAKVGQKSGRKGTRTKVGQKFRRSNTGSS